MAAFKSLELDGIALDYAISKIYEINFIRFSPEDFRKSWEKGEFRYSSDISLISEIIESEPMQTLHNFDSAKNKWSHIHLDDSSNKSISYGETFLKSFGRCIVLRHLGDSIEVPEEIL